MGPHGDRPAAAGPRPERLPRRRLRQAGDPARRPCPHRPGARERGLPGRDGGGGAAGRGLYPCRRHRHGPHRARRILRARGQLPHALRRLLHAGEPRGDAAALSQALRPAPHRPGRPLPGGIAGDAEGRRPAAGRRRSLRGGADPGPLQQRLLRALLPRRRDGDRGGGGRRPRRRERRGVHAHHRRAEAGRRDLPPHRRRIPRPDGLPRRQHGGRAGADGGLSRRQRRPGQCPRRRHRRRQGDLSLCAGDGALLPRRGAAAGQCADLPLRAGGGPQIRPRQPRQAGGEAGQGLGRLWHDDRAARDPGPARGIPHPHPGQAWRLHRPADARALDLPDGGGPGHRPAPRRPQALHPLRRQGDPHRPGRADPGRHSRGLAGGELLPGRRHQGYLDPGGRGPRRGAAACPMSQSQTAAG